MHTDTYTLVVASYIKERGDNAKYDYYFQCQCKLLKTRLLFFFDENILKPTISKSHTKRTIPVVLMLSSVNFKINNEKFTFFEQFYIKTYLFQIEAKRFISHKVKIDPPMKFFLKL